MTIDAIKERIPELNKYTIICLILLWSPSFAYENIDVIKDRRKARLAIVTATIV